MKEGKDYPRVKLNALAIQELADEFKSINGGSFDSRNLRAAYVKIGDEKLMYDELDDFLAQVDLPGEKWMTFGFKTDDLKLWVSVFPSDVGTTTSVEIESSQAPLVYRLLNLLDRLAARYVVTV